MIESGGIAKSRQRAELQPRRMDDIQMSATREDRRTEVSRERTSWAGRNWGNMANWRRCSLLSVRSHGLTMNIGGKRFSALAS